MAVVLTHSYAVVTGLYESEPLVAWLGHSIGHYAVDVFFVLSGFLVTQSLARDGDLLRFAVSRILRIFPALAVAVVASALVLGPLVTSLEIGAYIGHPALPAYVVGALSTAATDNPLPGVFTALPETAVVNAPLWTLKYELAAYAVGRGLMPWPETESFLSNALHLLVTFYLGAAAYIARRYLPLTPVIVVALVGLAILANPTSAREFSKKILIAYTILWLAFIPGLGGGRFERFGDCSYGIYIFAFPIQQALRFLAPDIEPLALFAAAIAITVPLALLSWHLVEKPSLGARHKVVAWLRSFSRARAAIAKSD